MPGFRSEKLRVNLRLAVNRLKLLEKKKTEQALKARREIADYIKNKRIERARIRVEHIIREDYYVEAMEVVELYCDLLLARFGMLETMKYCEDSLTESVSTLIWVTPRLSADIQELREISHQLENKFGKEFTSQAKTNMSGTVNPKVIHRMGVDAPKKSLVENYMLEIARNYNVEYEPDTSMFLEDDGLSLPPGSMDKPFLLEDEPPLPHKEVPPHSGPFHPPPSQPPYHQPPPPAQTQHFQPPPPSHQQTYQPPAYPGPPSGGHLPPTNPDLPYPTGPQAGVQPPSLPDPPPHTPTGAGGLDLPSGGLDLPPVPNTSFPENSTGSDAGGGSVDFDDLTRRFEELKRRK